MIENFDPKSIRIAAFDLDGTTLQDGYLSPAVEKALRTLAKMGIAVTVATGRDISQIPLNVLDCFQYRVTTNGASVTDKDGNVLSEHTIDAKTAYDTLCTVRRHGAKTAVYYNGYVLASPAFLLRLLRRTNYLNKSHRKTTKSVRKGKIRFFSHQYVRRNAKDVYKIQCFFKSSSDQEAAARELERTLPVNPCMLEDASMEISYKGVSKAHGMLELCESLGCKAENIIAFGDSANDLELLKTAGFSVGMGNAEQCVKLTVDYITDPVTEDGVATAISHLFSL